MDTIFRAEYKETSKFLGFNTTSSRDHNKIHQHFLKSFDTFLQAGRKFNFELAANVRKQPVGAFTPNFKLLDPLEEFLRLEIPEDGYKRASGRLYLTLTNTKTIKNEVMHQYHSNEELLKV